jgi:hypothetical protein
MKLLFAAILLGLAGLAGAVDMPFEPDTPYYFDHFEPEQKPWQPGQDLNIEEVYKNYQYYEIHFMKGKREIQVTRYIRNRRENSERYRIQPDGALEKLAP